MNNHLPVFVEVQCYNRDLASLRKMIQNENNDSEEEEQEELYERGYESDAEDQEECFGVKGMTL